MIRMKITLTGAALLCLMVPAFAGPSPILERAARGIEAHRKADARITVVRQDGTAVPGARIEVIQKTHDFAFGNVFRPRHYDNEQYRARFLEIFNFVQLLEFNWGQYETEEGKPQLAQRMKFINGWCREHGLTRFYGHMLIWARQEDEIYGPEIPHWVFRYDRATQDRLLKERILREVQAYRDVDIIWDVVNEAIHCRRWGAWDKPGYIDEPIPDVVPYVHDAFTWAREGNPQAKLLLNDYRVIPQNKYRDRYIELIDLLKKKKDPDGRHRHSGARTLQGTILVFARGNLGGVRAVRNQDRPADPLHGVRLRFGSGQGYPRHVPARQVGPRETRRGDRGILPCRLRASGGRVDHLLRPERKHRALKAGLVPAGQGFPAQAGMGTAQETDQGRMADAPNRQHRRGGRLRFARLPWAI